MHIIQFGIITLSVLSVPGSSTGPELYLLALSGDRQIGIAGQVLPEPIVARLTDDAGNGVVDRPLVFDSYDSGWLIDASGEEHSQLVLRTDARGDAAAGVRLGSGSNPEARFVRVSTPGVSSPATFSFWHEHVAIFVCKESTPPSRIPWPANLLYEEHGKCEISGS